MRKIVLLGDSIRLGYAEYVREALADTAEVLAPADNCRFSFHLLRYAHEWSRDWHREEVELVHWNAGLWDALHLFGDEALVPLSAYEATVGRIHTRLRMLFPNARLVFATSTSVWEERQNPDFRRSNAELEQYNQAARRALSDLDSEIDDLWRISCSVPQEARSDAVHFNTPLGCELLGGAVLSFLCPRLGIHRESLRPVAGKVPEIDAAILGG